MKRQIIHQKCYMPQERLDFLQYAGEWEKTFGGRALNDCLCDLCGGEIKAGEYCYAQSYGLDSQPYQRWEHNYLEVKEGHI